MKLPYEFYHRPCLQVARELVGKILVHRTDGVEHRLRITETEAYCGENDTACHAHKGRTKRTEVMYMDAGTIYIYLCYGVHWMLNIVTGREGEPQAIPDADILKVAHHGSDKATSERFLAACTPELAVISVGENNFGHPAEETLQKLDAVGAKTLLTRDCGAITLTWHGGWQIDTYLEAGHDVE